jgi:hypothetical protein
LQVSIGHSQVLISALLEHLKTLEGDFRTNYAPAWAAKTGDQRGIIVGKLNEIQTAFRRISADGPTEPASDMYKAYASNSSIFLIGLWAILGIAGMLVLVTMFFRPSFPGQSDSQLGLVCTLGALGGFLSCVQSLGLYVGNRQFLRSWTMYYVLFPLKGAGLALVVYFFLQTRVITFNVGEHPSEFGLAGYCLVAALTGLFSNQAIEMLAGLFSIIFQKIEAKDKFKTNAELTLDNILGGPANPTPNTWWKKLRAWIMRRWRNL